MNHPNELSYSKSHEWVKMDGDTAIIGISDFAQDALGDVVFVNLPAEGDDVTAAEAFGDVESVKAVSDLICPVTGKVAAINEELLDSPELLNSDPYGAWIIKVEGITDKEAAGRGGIRRVLRTGGLNNGQLRSIYRGGTQRDAQGHRSYGLPGALPRCA